MNEQIRYAKLENGIPNYAGEAIPTSTGFIAKPTHKKLIEHEWYPVNADWMPTEQAPDGKEWIRTGKFILHKATPLTDSYIHPEYALHDIHKPTLADFDFEMEKHLRSERSKRGYTTREPDSYSNSSIERWAQDARDWVAHRDAVMVYAQNLINEVESGQREPPTMDEFKSGLPSIIWTFT